MKNVEPQVTETAQTDSPDDAPELPPDGTVVTAKRRGWDEVLTPEQLLDMDPYEPGPDGSDDLRGPIVSYPVPGNDHYRPVTVCLVGGQSADPKTVKVAGGGQGSGG